jgi:hypothetical protein
MRIRVHAQSIQIRQAILHFAGWPDAGSLIELILSEFKKMYTCEHAASWDLDGFWHTEATRPQVRIQHGQIKQFEWPEYKFHLCKPVTGETVLLGTGPEPNCSWRVFVENLLQQLQKWGCKEIFLLGSMLDQIFHDEVLISCIVQDEHGYNQVREQDCQRIEYEGPAAIHGAIMESALSMGIRCFSFWAHLPFYLKGPNELLAAHYLKILTRFTGGEPDTTHLLKAWKDRQSRIESYIEQDDQLRQTLELLKQQERPHKISSYSPAKIVRMEEFLRRRNDQDTDPEKDS